jgi:polyphosphate kinase 2 (PPK2 family)
VIFDRSWYNRAGVERVMGFATKEQIRRFLDLLRDRELHRRRRDHPDQILARGQRRGTEASLPGPHRRPGRQWKLSPMDLPSRTKWYDYFPRRATRCSTTDGYKHAPWYVLRSDDKKRARLNCIRHSSA